MEDRKQATKNFSFSFLQLRAVPKKSTPGKRQLHLTSQFQSYLNPLPFSLPYYSLPRLDALHAGFHRLYFLFFIIYKQEPN